MPQLLPLCLEFTLFSERDAFQLTIWASCDLLSFIRAAYFFVFVGTRPGQQTLLARVFARCKRQWWQFCPFELNCDPFRGGTHPSVIPHQSAHDLKFSRRFFFKFVWVSCAFELALFLQAKV